MDRDSSLIDTALKNLIKITGTWPWSFIYNTYKWKMIEKYLKFNFFNNGELTKNYGVKIDERIIEYPWLLSRLPDTIGVLLDAGSALNYRSILNQPSIKNKKIFISTLAPEKRCFWGDGISYTYEDLRNTCYKDCSFDWIVSISTIEHIGLDNTLLYTENPSLKENLPSAYLTAIKELHRILKPGGTLFITVPYGTYKNHGWFQVFDERMIDNLISAFNPDSFSELHFRYIKNGWEKSDRLLSRDATYYDIQNKNWNNSQYSPFSRAVVCLELRK
jgi:SAM-dependent methyltransferase